MQDARRSSYNKRHASNGTAHPLRHRSSSAKTSRRSPYGEPTKVVRVPQSLLPRLAKMLDKLKSDVKDSSWLDKCV